MHIQVHFLHLHLQLQPHIHIVTDMHIDIIACMYIYIYVYIYTSIYIYTRIHLHFHLPLHLRVQKDIDSFIWAAAQAPTLDQQHNNPSASPISPLQGCFNRKPFKLLPLRSAPAKWAASGVAISTPRFKPIDSPESSWCDSFSLVGRGAEIMASSIIGYRSTQSARNEESEAVIHRKYSSCGDVPCWPSQLMKWRSCEQSGALPAESSMRPIGVNESTPTSDRSSHRWAGACPSFLEE